MRMPSGVVDQVVFFVAVDSTDLKTRETGLTSFTVYRARNTGASTAMTTPTVAELSAANMPGVYSLLLDEDMTIDSGDDSQEMVFHITQASMAPVTRTIEIYRTNVTHINGGATDGYNATLKLQAIDVKNSAGDAIRAESTGGNGSGIYAEGDGSGPGLHCIAGATLGASGAKFKGTNATESDGISCDGFGSGAGMALNGGNADGVGLDCRAGVDAAGDPTGDGFGISARGGGGGAGLWAIGGATWAGIVAEGGAGEADIEAEELSTIQQLAEDILARESVISTLVGEVLTDGGNSATSFKTDLTAPATDHFKDAFVKITGGALANQLREITGSTGTVDVVLTVDALTATPADGVTFEIVND